MTGKGYIPKKPGTRIKRFDRPESLEHVPHKRTIEDVKITRAYLLNFHRYFGRDSMFWAHPGETLGSFVTRGMNYFDLTEMSSRITCLEAYSREHHRMGKRLEGLAKREEDRGRKETALRYYYRAAVIYLGCIWPIFDSESEELKFYRERINACYKKICQFSQYPLQRVEIPFDGKSMPAYFHSTPTKEKAPTVLFIGGMDQWKEMFVNPSDNQFVTRGMNVIAFDGPGQGESLEREIYHDTPDKFARAGEAVIDWLVKRHEVDADRIGIWGNSMGTYFGPLVAARDSRVKGMALGMSCYYPDSGQLFNIVTPNYRCRWQWMANIDTDDEFDDFLSRMTLAGKEHLIRCPILIFVGELDQLCSVWATYEFWKKTGSEIKELRIYADQFHGNLRFIDEMLLMMAPDWLRERLLGKPARPPKKKIVYVDRFKNEKPVNVDALEKGFSYLESQ